MDFIVIKGIVDFQNPCVETNTRALTAARCLIESDTAMDTDRWHCRDKFRNRILSVAIV
jgi:hypothetical protein